MQSLYPYQGLRWLCLIAALAAAWPAAARYAPKRDLEVAYVYNILRFTTGFAVQENQPLVVCIDGDQQALHAFRALDGRPVQGAPVDVRSYAAARVTNCHALVIAAPTLLQCPNAPGLLTIATLDQPVRQCMIELVAQPKKIGFRVDRDTAHAFGLEFSATLLRLAQEVKG